MGLPAVQSIVQTEVARIFAELKIDRKYILTEAKEMYDNLKAIEESRDTEKNPSMALTEILNIRFRLLKFFKDSLEESQPAPIEGTVTEKTTYELTSEQMEAKKRGEEIQVEPVSKSLEFRRVIKGTTPAMPGEKHDKNYDGSGGDSGCGMP